LKFIHISDRHWHSNNLDNGPLLSLQEVLDTRFRDHIILEPGDITDDGHYAQYERVQEAMERWKGRWIFCPGNHDFGTAGVFFDPVKALRFDEMLSEPFLNSASNFSGINMPVISLIEKNEEKVLLIALDSNLETESPWDFACGEIGKHQLEALSRILKEHPVRTPWHPVKIVMMHHHPWIHWNPFMKLRDATSLLMRLRGKVDVLLFGHRHKEGIWRNKWNIPLTIAAPAAYEAPWFREIVVDGGRVTTKVIQWS